MSNTVTVNTSNQTHFQFPTAGVVNSSITSLTVGPSTVTIPTYSINQQSKVMQVEGDIVIRGRILMGDGETDLADFIVDRIFEKLAMAFDADVNSLMKKMGYDVTTEVKKELKTKLGIE